LSHLFALGKERDGDISTDFDRRQQVIQRTRGIATLDGTFFTGAMASAGHMTAGQVKGVLGDKNVNRRSFSIESINACYACADSSTQLRNAACGRLVVQKLQQICAGKLSDVENLISNLMFRGVERIKPYDPK
jgi:hypothetical protein